MKIDTKIIEYIEGLPLEKIEKAELLGAYVRSCSDYWVNARKVIKNLSEERLEMKKIRTYKRLPTEYRNMLKN